MILTRRYQLLLICVLVLTSFYPALFAEFVNVDDQGMITEILNMTTYPVMDLFFPHGTGLYYRPLTYLTYILDKIFWFQSTSFMHLENILLHLFNVVMVYFLTLNVLEKEEQQKSYIPFLAALLFGLNPICCEPVAWVSSRPELLACFFVLSACLFLVRYLETRKAVWLVPVCGAILLGITSKETALGIVPGLFFFLISRWRPEDEGRFWTKGNLRRALISFSVVCLLGLLFLGFRSFIFTKHMTRVGMSIKYMLNGPVHTIFIFLGTFGFYMKKIFWPWPLNFTIVEIDPVYELLGILLVIITLYVCFQRNRLSAVFMAGVIMFTPAFPVAYGQIAWTPFAERYAYIPSSFIIIATVIFLGRILRRDLKIPSLAGASILGIIIVSLGVATLTRTMVFRTNIILWSDTVKKSPDFSKAWNQLGVAYAAVKDYASAEKAFATASKFYSMEYDPMSDVNLAASLQEQGKIDQAEKVYERLFKKKAENNVHVVENYIEFLERRIKKESGAKADSTNKEMLKYAEKLYKLTGEPETLYKMGSLSLAVGDKEKARKYYNKVIEKLPKDDKRSQWAKQYLSQN